ncbi:hypothetical protein E4631_12055 [Hymenobacter sp. UV11]|uniref:SHOCT domain-containing protein n=1 Tax=Hymenobacter sp. UV11 TaxID=1849735 RepID=UPI00106103DB|nr:SHOCT domain-containing protein [Hymenobacter sp. UV11]TDN39077.1 hypothetical protein A8B98_21545 [Hymenobacter sp. UV11]TFZ65836.1 hypothetical protein E4631_12055 [Hymenobacter sp. UV11]
MSPSDAHSSLAALRQLKEMLDAGTITPAEFETLKRQLIFGNEPFAPPVAPTPPASAEAVLVALGPDPASYPGLSPEIPVEPAPTPPPAVAPDWLAAAAPGLPLIDEASLPPLAERRNPLSFVFLMGGVLVLLGIVLFLFMDRPNNPDEHLTSASQTAADSVATVPEVGPQAEQITLPPAAAPETIRVAPVIRPAPVVRPLSVDTATVPAPVVAAPVSKAPAQAAPVAPPAKAPAAVKPAAPPAPKDSTTKTP